MQMLLFDCFPREKLLSKKYNNSKKCYDDGCSIPCLYYKNIFGPYPKNEKCPRDISYEENLTSTNKEVHNLILWIEKNIIINLGTIFDNNYGFDYRTVNVYLRIATGMLNKINIPKEIKIMYHDNMVNNIHREIQLIADEELPF